MSSHKLTVTCVLLTVLCQGIAQAQPESYSGPPGGYYPVVPPYPPDMFFTYHHASTALEGALRGMAALRYANGTFLVNASQAAILKEHARWLAMENKQRRIEYRIGLRVWHEFERQANLAKKRAQNEAQRPVKMAAYRLGSSELDRATGQILWPTVLQADAYQVVRAQLDELFHEQAVHLAPNATRQHDIAKCVKLLQSALRNDRGQSDWNDYQAAQRFLCGLKYDREVHTQLD